MTIRTRFAPSPTGNLHIGGARTALFNWLYARKHGGQFILRIEDTDLARSTQASVAGILDSMKWLGLYYDEKPYYQTQRMARYKEVIAQLIAKGDAYPCYCTQEEVDAMRDQQRANKQKPRYDRRCRTRTSPEAGIDAVIRFKQPTTGAVVIDDVVKGQVVFQNSELDDFIIARADGSPTYNLTVVVDDMDMQISHVIRGDDHLNNTPKQVNLFNSLSADIPVFAHLPMIAGADGARLSKRHGAAGVMEYRDKGFLPDALLNYLVRLGWSHGDREVFMRDEMLALFDITGINKSAARFDTDKLLWLNQHYIKEGDQHDLAKYLAWHMSALDIGTTEDIDLAAIVALYQDRAKTLAEIAENSQFFYKRVEEYDAKAAAKHLIPDSYPILKAMHQRLEGLSDWQAEAIHDAIKDCADYHGVGMGKVAQPIRVAITGNTVSPPLDRTLKLLGRSRTLDAITRAVSWINDLSQ